LSQRKNQPNRLTVKDHREAASILGGMVGRLKIVRDLLQSRYGRQHPLSKNGQSAVSTVNLLRTELDDLAQRDFAGAGISYPVGPSGNVRPDPALLGHAVATPSESEGVD
jgi:hypothetical protein